MSADTVGQGHLLDVGHVLELVAALAGPRRPTEVVDREGVDPVLANRRASSS